MATIQVSVDSYYDSEFPAASSLSVTGVGNAVNNPAVLVPGDTLRVNFVGGPGSITVAGFDTTNWTSGAALNILSGGNGSRVSRTGVNLTGSLVVSWTMPNNAVKQTTIYFRIGNPQDLTPNQFSFSSTTQAARNTLYGSNSITISGMSAGATTTATVSGGNGTYMRKNGGSNTTSVSVGNGDVLQLFQTSLNSNYATSTATLNINGVTANWSLRTADIEPASVDIGANIVGAALSALYNSAALTISGLEVSVTASVSGGGAYLRKNNDVTNRTSVAVANGDVIRVYMAAPASFAQTNTTTFTVGGLSRAWSVSTPTVNPQNGTKISIGVSGPPLSLSQVADFFGGFWHPSKPRNLGAYLKGDLVPNITENSAIPASAPLHLSHFINARTSMYWTVNEIPPVTQWIDTFVDNGNVPFQVPVRNYLGYGNIAFNCEFRYVANAGGAQLAAGMTSYSPNNGNLAFTVFAPANQASGTYDGTITCYARNRYLPSTEFSITLRYVIELYNSNL